jgi:hypothetical protein|tara:strand:- start:406 stop:1077 length:672 start_codon:yes stop_codon:yes gene_type:complete
MLIPDKIPPHAPWSRRSLRNGSVLVTANPSFNGFLCPTGAENKKYGRLPPMLLHVARGIAALGRCAPDAIWGSRTRRGRLAHSQSDWKGVITSRVLIEGLQEVRDACCLGYDSFRKQLKRGGGSVAEPDPNDRVGALYHQRPVLNGVSVKEVAAKLSVCGVPGDKVALSARIACDDTSEAFKRWEASLPRWQWRRKLGRESKKRGSKKRGSKKRGSKKQRAAG